MNEKDPTRALPMRYYSDPLEALIADESATCKGCVREDTIFGTTYCTKGRRHGTRCVHYVERRALGR